METKQRKGISLVALIITIIVLIILTGAVIMSITGEDSTIGKANEAVFKSNLTNYRDEFTRNVMQKQLEQGGTFDKTTLTDEDIADFIPNITDRDAEKLGIVNGELVYKDTSNEEEFGWAAELNMADLTNVLAGQEGLEVGDYIKYTPGVGSYIVTAQNSGQVEAIGDPQYMYDKTFETSATVEDWRILSIKGSEVTIVKEGEFPQLWLLGVTGYTNAVKELNNICAIYKNPAYAKEARSITIQDINDIAGYTQEDMETYGGGSSQAGGYKYTASVYNDIIDKEETYIQDFYDYNGDIKELTTEDEKYKMIFANPNVDYWIASNYIRNWGDDFQFGVRYMNNGFVYGEPLYSTSGEKFERELGVRPVVILKSNVKVTGGPGTFGQPWVISEN